MSVQNKLRNQVLAETCAQSPKTESLLYKVLVVCTYQDTLVFMELHLDFHQHMHIILFCLFL